MMIGLYNRGAYCIVFYCIVSEGDIVSRRDCFGRYSFVGYIALITAMTWTVHGFE